MPIVQTGFLQPGPIAPWAKLGENLLVRRAQEFALYEVKYLEQIPLSKQMVVDFGAIAANATINAQNLQVPLEMDGFELGQFRMHLLEDIELRVYEPQSLPRFVTKQAWNRVTKYQQEMIDPCGHLTEICVFQTNWPFVDVVNPRAYALTSARVGFFGFRYQVIKRAMGATIQAVKDQAMASGVSATFTGVIAEGFVGQGFERID